MINIQIQSPKYDFLYHKIITGPKWDTISNRSKNIFNNQNLNTTLDICLEYRPNENNSENINKNNYSDENLIDLKEQSFLNSNRAYFYLSSGDKLIVKKDFENKSLISNLILESKNINPKDIKDMNISIKLILEAYSIKCVQDKEQTPTWMLNPNEYKGDIYWKISVFSTDTLTFVKNTIIIDNC